jgi:hypothetical protein
MMMLAALLWMSTASPALPAIEILPAMEALTDKETKSPSENTKPENTKEDTLCSAVLDVCFSMPKRDDQEGGQTPYLKITPSKAVQGSESQGSESLEYPLSDEEQKGGYDRGWFKLWPNIIRAKTREKESSKEIILFGVVEGLSTMYSGGGARSETLTLYRLPRHSLINKPFDKAQPPFTPVLSFPLSGHVMIRACFSEKDMKLRRNICHDFYDFDANLTLGPKVSPNGYPELMLKAEATAQPGLSRRSEDNTSGRKRLTKAEAKEAVDPDCTFTRIVRFDEKTQAYVFDTPLPDCSDYTVP